MHINRPSPAMVVAMTALVFGATGTTYAAVKLPAKSVGTPHLKNNAVTSAKLKNGSVTAFKVGKGSVDGTKVKPDSLGGAQIDESTLGPVPTATSAGISGLTYSAGNATLGPNQGATLHADCPLGLKPISGGLKVGDPANVFVIDGYPQGNGWTSNAANTGSLPEGATVFVVCAQSPAIASAPPKPAKARVQRYRLAR